jgi:ketosteroid isomerase-like protein
VSEHGNAALLERLFDAFARRDGEVVAGLLGEDVVWTVPGDAPVAGEHRGRRPVVRFLGRTTRLTEGTYRSELRYALGGGDRAVAVYRATGRRPDGRTLDIDQILLCRVEDGQLVEVAAVPTDQAAFEAFWA